MALVVGVSGVVVVVVVVVGGGDVDGGGIVVFRVFGRLGFSGSGALSGG